MTTPHSHMSQTSSSFILAKATKRPSCFLLCEELTELAWALTFTSKSENECVEGCISCMTHLVIL